MCDICFKTPCYSRCPNAPTPIPKEICKRCFGEIYEGDKYYDAPEGIVCEECLSELSLEEVFEMLGESLTIA